jgi:hypothetical protein
MATVWNHKKLAQLALMMASLPSVCRNSDQNRATMNVALSRVLRKYNLCCQ